MAEYYSLLRTIHISCISVSLCLFIFRGMLMLTNSAYLHKKWLRILPHCIDTLLLSSAILLTIILQQYPLMNSWLTMKLICLIIYIILGSIALKRGKTKQLRIIALLAAILIFLFMYSVARYHHFAGFLSTQIH